jgi:lipopolysaccharide export system permease protein
MTGFGRVERYVIGQMLLGVIAALAVITAVVVLIQFVELSSQVGTRVEVSAVGIFELTLLRVPSLVQILLPFCFLGGGMVAFVGLNRRSELVAMRAAGVSAWRFILPSAVCALLLGVLCVGVLNPMAADLNARFEVRREQVMENYLGDQPRDIWLRQGDETTQIVIHARDRDSRHGAVTLRGVSFFIYEKNERGIPEFRRRLEASEATLLPGFWRLKNVREATAGASSMRSDTLTLKSTLDAEAAMESLASPETIPFWRLPTAIRLTEQAGFSGSGYELRFQQLLATPLLFAAMTVLAAAFSLRLTRLGGLAGIAGVGVALGFVMFFFNQFAGALARADIVPLFAAAWAPAVVALLFGITLLCYTEDG